MLYLDHAASTNTFPSILAALPEKGVLLGNPSSVHQTGRMVRQVLDEARYDMGKILRAKLENIIFTSGATEALHLTVIGGLIAKCRMPNGECRILMSPIMHSAVFEAVKFLEENFQVTVEYLPLDKGGYFDLVKITEKKLSTFDMVIGEHGNSEIGIVQPVAKLGKMIRRIEGDRPKFIVDTAASVVDMDISLDHQVCDALVLSAEKFGGLKGSGVLIRDANFMMEPLIGGSQELGYRGGTENVTGIWAMAEALKLYTQGKEVLVEKYLEYHEFLNKFFVQNYEDVKVTTSSENYLPHIFHFLLPVGMDASMFVQQCDLQGVALSAGSACSSGSVAGSRVLSAMGYTEAESKRGIRISFGRETTMDEVKKLIAVLEGVL